MSTGIVQSVSVGHMPQDLESLLNAFRRFGNPAIRFMGNGWYCSIKMHVSSEGATFEVASDFKKETAMEAATECWQRMAGTLAQLAQVAP